MNSHNHGNRWGNNFSLHVTSSTDAANTKTINTRKLTLACLSWGTLRGLLVNTDGRGAVIALVLCEKL